MMLLIQGSIFSKGLVILLPSVSALVELLLSARRHMAYVSWTQVMVVHEPEA